MKEIKIQFTDIPESSFDRENNWIINTLREKYTVVISEEPEFLFYSVFGYTHMNYLNCVKIFFTGEVSVPNFNECDYALSFNYLTLGDRHFRGVVGDGVADTISNIKRNIQIRDNITDDMSHRKFCNFVYSQDTVGEGAILRKSFCQKLMEYKHIDCPGLVLNNMPVGAIEPRWKSSQYSIGNVNSNWNDGKIAFLENYKFTIAFENVRAVGYTTEKLIHPFMAKSVPIYWGNPSVIQDFNPRAFINCNDYPSLDDVIKRIIALDQDDTQYLEMLRQSPMANTYDFDAEIHVKEFLFKIVERGNCPFEKDPLSKDIVHQLRNDVVRAWQIIDSLKKEAKGKGITIGENQEGELPLTFKAANYLHQKMQSGFLLKIKNAVKPIVLWIMRLRGNR